MSDPCYELLKKLNDAAAMDRDPEREKPMKMGKMGNGPQEFTAIHGNRCFKDDDFQLQCSNGKGRTQ
jgi:hypothetical protein